MQRKTSQRAAIEESLRTADRPLSLEELLEQARQQAPGLGIATVYRNLKRLVEEGAVIPVLLPDEPSRYELAGKGHHHHFRCRLCHRVFDIKACPGELGRLVPEGFRLEAHEILLFGLCRACA
ncbi:MAG: transcriptional repressor [Calditrichaeota bacterium]|nr:transcriptional repressor [Candidatus Cloacimonadota bacterium]MCA9785526.1 transcriptional repressor [Candidatus Cloacimonadota bacterium]MCB1047744.1 transcriptional repressor [Calditrichota bacterium]MCB9473919.1 transcriptional repressor [Candidatus Delongbacteria bacterium]